RENSKECSNETARLKSGCAVAVQEVVKLTVPSFSTVGDPCSCCCAATVVARSSVSVARVLQTCRVIVLGLPAPRLRGLPHYTGDAELAPFTGEQSPRGPRRRSQIDLPERTVCKHRRLRSQERRNLVLQDPDMRVRRLLAQDRRDHAGHA